MTESSGGAQKFIMMAKIEEEKIYSVTRGFQLLWRGLLLGIVTVGCSSCESIVEAVPGVGDVYRENVRVPRQRREEAADQAKSQTLQGDAEQRLKQDVMAHLPRATFKTTGEFADAATFLVNSFNASHDSSVSRAELIKKVLVITDRGPAPYRAGRDFIYSMNALIIPFDQLDPQSVETDETEVRFETSFFEKKLIRCSLASGGSATDLLAKGAVAFPDAAQAARFGRALQAAIESAKGEPTRF